MITAAELGLRAEDYYRPLVDPPPGAGPDQGDPYVLVATGPPATRHRFYLFHTDHAVAAGRAIDAYGSDDLRRFAHLGKVLNAEPAYHWAPCVAAAGGRYLLWYSRSTPRQENWDVGHRLRVALAERPEGPYRDHGELALPPEEEFAIDADLYRDGAGRPHLAYCREEWSGELVGVGLAEVPLTDDLLELAGPPVPLARPSSERHRYEAGRSLPWRVGRRDWAAGETVDWYCMEAPVGGLVSPAGRRTFLYSFGNWQDDTYGIGALVDDGAGGWVDLVPRGHLVLHAHPALGISAIGHPALVGPDLLVAHGRFAGSPHRRAFLAPLAWDEHDRPFCPV